MLVSKLILVANKRKGGWMLMDSDFSLLIQGERERRPLTHKLYSRVAHIWGDRKGQPNRSAMVRPRPGRTA